MGRREGAGISRNIVRIVGSLLLYFIEEIIIGYSGGWRAMSMCGWHRWLGALMRTARQRALAS